MGFYSLHKIHEENKLLQDFSLLENISLKDFFWVDENFKFVSMFIVQVQRMITYQV